MATVLTLDFTLEVCSLTPFPNSLLFDFKKMRKEALELVGPSYDNYRITNLVFDTEERYVTWFDWGNRTMSIQIASSCLEDRPRCQYQLAHECVHSIIQSDNEAFITYLDEGCAEYFGRTYAAAQGHYYAPGGIYQVAFDLVNQLLNIDPTIIKIIRHQIHRIRDIQPQNLVDINNNISLQLATDLLTHFGNQLVPLPIPAPAAPDLVPGSPAINTGPPPTPNS